jgi:hypothetical protein
MMVAVDWWGAKTRFFFEALQDPWNDGTGNNYPPFTIKHMAIYGMTWILTNTIEIPIH